MANIEELDNILANGIRDVMCAALDGYPDDLIESGYPTGVALAVIVEGIYAAAGSGNVVIEAFIDYWLMQGRESGRKYRAELKAKGEGNAKS